MYIEALKMDSSEILNIFKGLGCQADGLCFQGDGDGTVTMQLIHGDETEFEYPLYESKTWLDEATEAFKKQRLEFLEFNLKLAKMKLDIFKRMFDLQKANNEQLLSMHGKKL